MSNAPTRQQPSSIDEAIQQFVPPSRFAELLELHRDRVLNLKVRGASYAQIHDLLKAYGIVASEPAIGRFCRKNREEVQRLRLTLEREGEPQTRGVTVPRNSTPAPTAIGSSTPQSTLNPITPPTRKMRDLRGEV
jgi:hypothetical protein